MTEDRGAGVPLLDVDGDGVSLHWIDREIDSERSQHADGLAAERDDIGVRIERALIGDDAGHAVAFEQQALHVRVEFEYDAAPGQKLGERDGELVAVAGLVIGQMQAARQLDGRGAQCRLDRHRLLGVDNAMRRRRTRRARARRFPPRRALPRCERLAARRRCRDRRRCRCPPQVLQACFAVMRDALHARLVAGEAFRSAVAQKAEAASATDRDRAVGARRSARDGANSQRATFAGIPGAAQGPANPGQMPPALAKLVSSAGPPWRSSTTTS